MKKETTYTVETPVPLLEFLLEHIQGQSRNSVKHLLSRGQVLVDGIPQKQFDLTLTPGQQVALTAPSKGPALPFPVLYEDEGLIAIHKPAGLLSVGTETEKKRTAYRILSDHLRSRNSRSRLLVVHRLDRDTSGVLLFSKDPELKEALQADWNGLVKRRGYWAIVEGEDLPDSGVCRSQLTESKVHRVYSARDGQGKEAVTRYAVLARRKGYSLLEVDLDTGRKNQIRAHLAELGHPVAGDEKYGARTNPTARLGLHAFQLSLTHPRSGKLLSFTAPPPEEFQRMFPNRFPTGGSRS